MKIGDNIQEIREREKGYKSSYVASCLGISTRAYRNIENNITDITLNRLEKIAEILECDPLYILQYKEIKDDFITNLRKRDKTATNTVKSNEIQLQMELLETQKNILGLLENLLTKEKNQIVK